MKTKKEEIELKIKGKITFKELANTLMGIQETFYEIADAKGIDRKNAELTVKKVK